RPAAGVGADAGGDVEPHSMVAARDDLAVEAADADRGARMGTGVVDREEAAVDVEDGDVVATDPDHLAAARRDLVHRGRGHEFSPRGRHVASLRLLAPGSWS